MDLVLDTPTQLAIQAYEDGRFRVDGQWYASAILIDKAAVSPIDATATLDATLFQSLHTMLTPPSILVIGTGARRLFLPESWLLPFYQDRIGVEVMDTPSAIRTYTVLKADDRPVTACLFP